MRYTAMTSHDTTVTTTLERAYNNNFTAIKRLENEIECIEGRSKKYLSPMFHSIFFHTKISEKRMKISYLKILNEQLLLLKPSIADIPKDIHEKYKISSQALQSVMNIAYANKLTIHRDGGTYESFEKDRGRTGKYISQTLKIVRQINTSHQQEISRNQSSVFELTPLNKT